MNERIMITAEIADIHFGAQSPRKLYSELMEYFITPLYKLPKLDLIVILGDTTDMKLPFDSEHSQFLNRFIYSDLYNVAKYHGASVRIIQGTKSHDNGQLRNFKNLEENREIDVKIIETVCEEEIDGCEILYIPEEYPLNAEEYYNDYMYKKYDRIFGHCLLREAGFSENKGEIQMRKAPVFSGKYLQNISHGPISLGHVHTGNQYYVGSFSRWVFGQEENKGFRIVTYDKVTKKSIMSFYKNEGSSKFISIDLEDYIHLEVDEIKSFIENYKENNKIDKLRLFINMEDVEDSYIYKVDLLKRFYHHNPQIVLLIKNDKLKIEKQNSREIDECYDYLFEHDLELVDKLQRFIMEDLNVQLDGEIIRQIIE